MLYAVPVSVIVTVDTELLETTIVALPPFPEAPALVVIIGTSVYVPFA